MSIFLVQLVFLQSLHVILGEGSLCVGCAMKTLPLDPDGGNEPGCWFIFFIIWRSL